MGKYDASERLLAIYQHLYANGRVRSRADFAKKAGLLPATINEILAKRQNVTVTQIYKICCAFTEIQPNDFFELPHLNSGCQIQGTNIHDNVQNDLNAIKDIIVSKDKQIERLIEVLAKRK